MNTRFSDPATAEDALRQKGTSSTPRTPMKEKLVQTPLERVAWQFFFRKSSKGECTPFALPARVCHDFDLKNGIEKVETKGYSAVPAVISLARKSSDCSWTWLRRGHLMTPSIWRPGVTVQALGRGATCFESWRDAGCFIHCAVYDPAR